MRIVTRAKMTVNKLIENIQNSEVSIPKYIKAKTATDSTIDYNITKVNILGVKDNCF